MKQKIFYLIALTLVFSVTACSDPDEDNGGPNNPDVPNEELFVGTMAVFQQDSTSFSMDSVRVSVTANDTLHQMTMVMHQVRFSPNMPVKLDMTLRAVSYVSNQSGLALSGDTIVPFAMGGAFTKYTITNLNGMISDDTLRLSMKCGSYPLSFKGVRK